MKILLTGANGLVGQKIKKELVGKEDVDLMATSLHPEVNPLAGRYHFQTLDITVTSHLQELISHFQPHTVINCAAQANVNRCEQEKTECLKINTEAVAELTRLANKNNIHLIQLSSDFVFAGLKTNYQEEDEAAPVNYYGLAKKEAEDHIISHARKWSIVRTILVYGFVPEMHRQNLVTWVIQSLQNNQPIRVVNDQYRMPTLGEDLARAVGQMALMEQTGIYHISGRELMSIEQMAHRVAEYFSLPSDLISPVTSSELQEPARRPPQSGFNLLKAEKELDYIPHSFEEGLKIIEKQIDKIH